MPARLRRAYGTGYLHFITFSCYQRRPLLGAPRCRDLFLRILEETSVTERPVDVTSHLRSLSEVGFHRPVNLEIFVGRRHGDSHPRLAVESCDPPASTPCQAPSELPETAEPLAYVTFAHHVRTDL